MCPYNGAMLTFLVVTIIVLVVFVGLVLKHNMALISTLAPRLQALQSKLNAVSLDVQRLKDEVAAGGQIPIEAEALLFNLEGTVDALVVNAAPTPAPSPLP
jgi:hypothetical protein